MSTKTSVKYIIHKTYKIRIAVSNCGRNNKLFWYFLIRQKIILFSEKTLLLYTRILLCILGKVQGISTQVFMVYIATGMKIHFMIVLIIRKSQIHIMATALTLESHAVSGQRQTDRQTEAVWTNQWYKIFRVYFEITLFQSQRFRFLDWFLKKNSFKKCIL